MVYYFMSNVTDPPTNIYVGKDKFESMSALVARPIATRLTVTTDENLIKYGLEEDVCTNAPAQFHVDNLSSAHIYVRMQPGEEWDKLPQALLDDCAQLTKANSIEGNKKDNITVIYTPWANLRKDGSMAVGQVAFHSEKRVRRLHVPARVNAVVNRLNKTRVERQPDLAKEKEDALRQVRKKDQAARRERDKEELRVAKERKEKAWQRDHAYDELHTEESVLESSNQDRGKDWEDDFM